MTKFKSKTMSKDKAQMSNQVQSPNDKTVLRLEHPDFINFPKNPPLKIRGARPARRTNSLAGGGVMRITEITPFIPLTLRWRLKGGSSFGI